jgi:hypothetical protein
MRFLTEGERLFRLVQNEVLNSIGNGHRTWNNLANLLDCDKESSNFSSYISGTLSVFSVRKLLRYWADEKKLIADESMYVARLKKHIKENVFIGLTDDIASRLARACIAAEEASNKKITKSVRENVLAESTKHNCYLCDDELDFRALENEPNMLTLEHLWPTSIGGDSIEENLLPACTKCQKITKDTMSWEWLNVHNLVLPTNPSSEALKSVTQKQRFARHYLHVLTFCENEKINLKKAFLRIGPMKEMPTFLHTGLPITFFDLNTAKEN